MQVSEQESMAMFRFGVIAPIVCRRFEEESHRAQAMREILTKEWSYPDGSVGKIPGRTVRYWLSRYEKYGIDGLYDGLRKPRANKGRAKAIPADILEKAEALRRELPSRSARVVINLLEAQGVNVQAINERTLQRHLKRVGAKRGQLQRGEEYFERWEQKHANDLWQADTAHAIWLPDPTNPKKTRRTKLIAFIDDATRVCTHAEFYFDERLPSLIDTFSKALISYGRPRRLLLDNAFIFHSQALQSMCIELVTELSFCKPRRPQGKGKIERFFRTVREEFMNEAQRAGYTTLSGLNEDFQAWLQRYHSRVHSELEMPPKDRWEKDRGLLTAVSPEMIRRALMLRASRLVNEQTATVSLDGESYQCSPALRGQSVEVRWHPNELDRLELWLDGKFFEICDRIAARPTHLFGEGKVCKDVDPTSYPILSTSKTFVEIRSGDAPTKLQTRPDQFLACEEFTQMVARYLDRSFSSVEQEKIAACFRKLAPLRSSVVECALDQAVRVKGQKLHVRYYLQHLEQQMRTKGR